MIVENFGEKAWDECLQKQGFGEHKVFSLTEDVEEELSMGMFTIVCDTLSISMDRLFDMFGEYWSCQYAPHTYSFWYIGAYSARDMILKMDTIHSLVGRHFNNAHPPRFDFQWIDPEEKRLLVTYKSARNLVDLFISLAKGVGKYYNEELEIEKISESQLVILFP